MTFHFFASFFVFFRGDICLAGTRIGLQPDIRFAVGALALL